jgi:hypothetical protein
VSAGRVLVLVAVTAALTACASSTGTFNVELNRGAQRVTLTVIDETGLVTGVAAGASDLPDPLPAAPFAWHPRGKLTTVGVYWESGVCSERPTIRLSGNALLLTIDEGPQQSPCDLIAVINEITITLNEVVDADAITVQMASASGAGSGTLGAAQVNGA